jgi:hypothetical protein
VDSRAAVVAEALRKVFQTHHSCSSELLRLDEQMRIGEIG